MKAEKILSVAIAAAIVLSSLFTASAAEKSAIKLEFEDYIEENSAFSLFENESGDKMAGISKISSSKYTYSVSFEVQSEGEYTMNLAAAAYAENISANYSDVSWSLNGGEALSLNSCETKSLMDMSGTPQRTLFTQKVRLEKGENTLILSGGKRSGKPTVTFYLDYAEFLDESNEHDEPTEEKRRWEVEDITAEGIVNDANVSGGKFQVYKSTSTDDVIEHFDCHVEKSGEYTLSFACADYSNMPFLSQLYFSVNGGEYVEINSSTCSAVPLEALSNSALQGTFGLYKYSYKKALSLEAGEFTVDIKAVGRLNTDPGEGVYFSFDYIELEDKKEPEPVISSTGRQEIEDITDECIASDKNVSGGKYQVYKSASTEDVVQRFRFKLDESGMYTVSVAAGTYAKMAYLSPLYISINGGDYIELNDLNCYIAQLEELADPAMRATYNMYSFTYKNDINLEEGVTTLDIKATARPNAEATPGVYFSLDYAEVLPAAQLDGLYAETDGGFVTCGRNGKIKLFGGNGKEIDPSELTDIKYTSSDERVVCVNSDGILSGRNFGSAVIHIEAKRRNVQANAECKIYVTDEHGLYISGAERKAGTVSVTLGAAKKYTPNHKILIAVYGTDGGYATSVKKIYFLDTVNMNNGESKTLETAVEADQSDIINVFMINSKNDKNAVSGKISL